MKKVKANYIGMPSRLAYCDDCNWNHERHDDPRGQERAVRKHVAESGHRVQLEKTVVVEYVLVEKAG